MAQFRKGQSGNPAGRPKGSGKSAKLRAAIEQHLPEIIDGLVQAAKSGDTAAARLLLDKALPNLRPVDAPSAVPRLEGKDLTSDARSIIESLSAGEIDAAQASALMGTVLNAARVKDAVEAPLNLVIERGDQIEDGSRWGEGLVS